MGSPEIEPASKSGPAAAVRVHGMQSPMAHRANPSRATTTDDGPAARNLLLRVRAAGFLMRWYNAAMTARLSKIIVAVLIAIAAVFVAMLGYLILVHPDRFVFRLF